MGGYAPGGARALLVPENYSSPPVYRGDWFENNAGAGWTPDPRWETRTNYKAAGFRPVRPGTELDELPQIGRAVGELIVRQQLTAAPGVALCPSVSISTAFNVADDAHLGAAASELAAYCAAAAAEGGVWGFWWFEAGRSYTTRAALQAAALRFARDYANLAA
jgi:hypothetical protein